MSSQIIMQRSRMLKNAMVSLQKEILIESNSVLLGGRTSKGANYRKLKEKLWHSIREPNIFLDMTIRLLNPLLQKLSE